MCSINLPRLNRQFARTFFAFAFSFMKTFEIPDKNQFRVSTMTFKLPTTDYLKTTLFDSEHGSIPAIHSKKKDSHSGRSVEPLIKIKKSTIKIGFFKSNLKIIFDNYIMIWRNPTKGGERDNTHVTRFASSSLRRVVGRRCT